MPHSTTGVNPAKLMYQREIRSRFSLLRPQPIAEKSSELLEKQARVSSGIRQVDFRVGEKVMLRDYRKDHKPWTLGTIIEESIPDTTYIIDVEGNKWKRHVNQVMNCSDTLLE
jgi:hypothetical protein